jgi:hypothetical protein
VRPSAGPLEADGVPQDNNCPVSRDLVHPHLADLRRARSAETASWGCPALTDRAGGSVRLLGCVRAVQPIPQAQLLLNPAPEVAGVGPCDQQSRDPAVAVAVGTVQKGEGGRSGSLHVLSVCDHVMPSRASGGRGHGRYGELHWSSSSERWTRSLETGHGTTASTEAGDRVRRTAG